jgi:hypothetical protein
MCGCGGSASKQQFEVTTADGTVVTVDSRTEALALVRRDGGTWQAKKAA